MQRGRRALQASASQSRILEVGLPHENFTSCCSDSEPLPLRPCVFSVVKIRPRMDGPLEYLRNTSQQAQHWHQNSKHLKNQRMENQDNVDTLDGIDDDIKQALQDNKMGQMRLSESLKDIISSTTMWCNYARVYIFYYIL